MDMKKKKRTYFDYELYVTYFVYHDLHLAKNKKKYPSLTSKKLWKELIIKLVEVSWAVYIYIWDLPLENLLVCIPAMLHRAGPEIFYIVLYIFVCVCLRVREHLRQRYDFSCTSLAKDAG